MPEISIIVPVYNTAPYVERCLESIMQQTFADWEVIVLNDGSPDHAEEVVLPYVQRDSRIRYYRHANRGLGPTRNRGIELAKGNYLSFVDSDDYILPDMLQDLYTAATAADADVVTGEAYLVYEGSPHQEEKRRLRNKLPDAVVDVTGYGMEQFMRDYYFSRLYTYEVWNKLYRTRFVQDNQIEFGDNRRVFSEDNYFQVQVLNHLQRVVFIDKPIYCYVQRPQSIMHTARKDILSRQLHFTHDLLAKISQEKGWLRQSLSVIFFDSLKAQTLNHVSHHAKRRESIHALEADLALFRNDPYYPEYRHFILEDRAYQFDANPYRRQHMHLVSRLVDRGWMTSAAYLLSLPYWMKKLLP